MGLLDFIKNIYSSLVIGNALQYRSVVKSLSGITGRDSIQFPSVHHLNP